MFWRKGGRSASVDSEAASEPALVKEIRGILSQAAGQHPLDVAARLAALLGARNNGEKEINYIRIRDIDSPCVCDLSEIDSNAVGLSFSFYGANGEAGLIYLTTAFAQLAPLGADPSPRIPAEMISRFVADYDEAIRKLVLRLSPRRSPEEMAQEEYIRSKLGKFLG